MAEAIVSSRPGVEFRHEALLYSGAPEFVSRTSEFIREGLEADERILVVVGAAKIAMLRAELGSDANDVLFADMAAVGANPARIIPAWHDFVDVHGPSAPALRGIGEPIYPERSPEELVECQRHEALLNLAFQDAPPFWLLCPYDTGALDGDVIDVAAHTHPHLAHDHKHRQSVSYACGDGYSPFEGALPPPATQPFEIVFDEDELSAVRELVLEHAMRLGLDPTRADDLVLAVNEITGNSIRHGGGHGVLRVWYEGSTLLCEVHDQGHIIEPLVGRRRPGIDQLGGRGVFLANQLTDLVQVRSSEQGTTIRIHMRR